MDKHSTSGLVFLDFKKVFDLVNHKVLLDKIGLYGGTVDIVNWFKSYLPDSRQCVKENGFRMLIFMLMTPPLRLVLGGMLTSHLWRRISMKI